VLVERRYLVEHRHHLSVREVEHAPNCMCDRITRRIKEEQGTEDKAE